jgi:16S rRNA processing protein RimM
VDEPTLVVGVVTSVHGLRGEVSIQNRSDNEERWRPGGEVLLPDGRRLTIEASRPHGRRLLVKFSGIEDRTAAEALRGTTLVVPESWLPSLPPGEWWAHQLQGSVVRTETGRDLGTLTEVVPNPANDIWVVVDADGRETLIPVLADLIVDVDPPGRRIVVRDVPGITVPDDPATG